MIRPPTFAILVLALLLTGCLTSPVPTQQNPACSWTSRPPAGADALCRRVFKTIATVTRAERRGDDATVHRYAVPSVARRIIDYGRALRRDGLIDLHAVPSMALDTSAAAGDIGAGFYLLGKTQHGPIKAQQGVFLRESGGILRIVHDQPGQEW